MPKLGPKSVAYAPKTLTFMNRSNAHLLLLSGSPLLLWQRLLRKADEPSDKPQVAPWFKRRQFWFVPSIETDISWRWWSCIERRGTHDPVTTSARRLFSIFAASSATVVLKNCTSVRVVTISSCLILLNNSSLRPRACVNALLRPELSRVVFRRLGIVPDPKSQQLLQLPVTVEQCRCKRARKKRRVQVQKSCKKWCGRGGAVGTGSVHIQVQKR